MSSTIRGGFNITKHVVDSSLPSFKLACNVYKTIPADLSSTTKNIKTPPMIFTHANGFHKEIWEPIMSRLRPQWNNSDMYAFDCLNHGDSATLNKDQLKNECMFLFSFIDLLIDCQLIIVYHLITDFLIYI
jgi:pimeloyl-ACP methyl ester carboxylesterase